MFKVIRICLNAWFEIASLRLMIGLRNSRHFLTQSEEKRNKQWLARARFPALFVNYTYLLRVLIGSLDCLCAFWLARVSSLVSVLRHQGQNCSVYMFFIHFTQVWISSVIKRGGQKIKKYNTLVKMTTKNPTEADKTASRVSYDLFVWNLFFLSCDKLLFCCGFVWIKLKLCICCKRTKCHSFSNNKISKNFKYSLTKTWQLTKCYMAFENVVNCHENLIFCSVKQIKLALT